MAQRPRPLGANPSVLVTTSAADDGLLLDVPLSQEQLASWVGASREATNIALRRLREEGAVATRRMRITILDVDALRAAASG